MSPTLLRGGSGLPKSATCILVLYPREVPATVGPENQLAAPRSKSSDTAPYQWMSRDWGHPATPLPLIILSLTLSLHAMLTQEEAPSCGATPLPLIILSSVPDPISPRPLAKREPSPVPLQTLPRRGWTGPPAAKHSPWLASPQRAWLQLTAPAPARG